LLAKRMRVRLAVYGKTLDLLGDGQFNADQLVASMSLSFGSLASGLSGQFYVAAWIDYDGDGKSNPYEILDISGGYFRIATAVDNFLGLLLDAEYIDGQRGVVPIFASFLKAFADGTMPEGAVGVTFEPVSPGVACADGSCLDHNVGVHWGISRVP